MTLETSKPKQDERVDRWGMLASGLCTVHCLIAALLPAAFGALGIGVLLGHEAEWLFTVIAVAIAGVAMAFSWRQHRSMTVAGLFLVGIVGLLASRGLEMGGGDHHHEAGAHPHEAHEGEHHHAEQGHHETAHTSVHTAGFLGIDGHSAGLIVGLLAGCSLLAAHGLNIRETRRCEAACECD